MDKNENATVTKDQSIQNLPQDSLQRVHDEMWDKVKQAEAEHDRLIALWHPYFTELNERAVIAKRTKPNA